MLPPLSSVAARFVADGAGKAEVGRMIRPIPAPDDELLGRDVVRVAFLVGAYVIVESGVVLVESFVIVAVGVACICTLLELAAGSRGGVEADLHAVDFSPIGLVCTTESKDAHEDLQ